MSLGTTTQPQPECSQEQTKLARQGEGLNWTEPMAQNLWTLVFTVGQMKKRWDSFHSGADDTETSEIWAQPLIAASVNLTTKPHPPMCGSPEMLSLRLHERISLLPATLLFPLITFNDF